MKLITLHTDIFSINKNTLSFFKAVNNIFDELFYHQLFFFQLILKNKFFRNGIIKNKKLYHKFYWGH